MADVKRLVFSILTFLEDQKKTGRLDDEQVESLEGNIGSNISICTVNGKGVGKEEKRIRESKCGGVLY